MHFGPNPEDSIRNATVAALARLIEPLLELMFDAGVTVQDLNYLVRERAVRVAIRRVSKEGGRNNKSRVSIATGIPRSEVTRILRSADSHPRPRPGQQPARKVLAAWYETPRFLAPSGEPAVLPIFGKRRSFEQLVTTHGGGIPVRAMLDELTQINAVERLPDQRVRAKTRIPIQTGLNAAAIAAIGDRGRDLFDTLIYNIKNVEQPMVEATTSISDADLEKITLLRREISDQVASFINAANSILNRSRRKRPKSPASGGRRIGVSVYLFDDLADASANPDGGNGPKRRTNLRRKASPKRTNAHPMNKHRSLDHQ